MATPGSSPSREAIRSALNKRLTDATRALQVFDHPGWLDLESYLIDARDQHEATLHNPESDAKARDRACWSVVIYNRILMSKAHFERMKKDAQSKLELLNTGKQSERSIDERIMTFMR